MILKNKLGKLKPRFLTTFEPLLKKYAQFGGGSAEDKFAKAKAFSNVYEFYMYCFFLGLNRNKKLEITGIDEAKGFWEIENWKPVELVEQLLVCALGESDFDFIAVEQMGEEELKFELGKILKLIEDFANGGLLIIQRELEDDEESAVDELFFVRLLAEEQTE
jgi:hypothetical protein